MGREGNSVRRENKKKGKRRNIKIYGEERKKCGMRRKLKEEKMYKLLRDNEWIAVMSEE